MLLKRQQQNYFLSLDDVELFMFEQNVRLAEGVGGKVMEKFCNNVCITLHTYYHL